MADLLTPAEVGVIRALIELARVTFRAFDDSEEFEGDDGRCHSISSQDFDDVEKAIDVLDELPDDKPGYAPAPYGKAQWALRRLLISADLPSEPLVRYCPGCGSVGVVESKYRDCCPDGGEARMIPQPLAEKCQDTFQIAIGNLGATQAEIAGLEAANLHLSAMIDELRELLQDAKRTMTELHQAAIPDESTEGVPAIIPPEAFRKFVDAHAMLCFCMHQRGHNPPKDGPQRG
ncbi:MAG: hypothetical protein QM569_14715 [Acidovorax sp.]|uniref:hypothetical protein n=1 Tax=Acidovorax sp. TaxID=1872122 RepID=UPI0039E6A370